MKPKMNGAAPQRKIPPEHFRVLNWGGELRIMDANGNQVPGIIACDVAMRPGLPPVMRINLAAGNFDVDGLPTFAVIDPRSGKFRPIQRIVFVDGGDDWVPPMHQPAPPAPPVAPPPAGGTEAPATETPTSEPQNAAEPQ